MLIRRTMLSMILAVSASTVQASFSYTGSAITENFNAINASGTTTSATAGVQFAIAGTGFDGVKLSGTGTTPMPFATDDGSSNAGGLKDYGIAAAPTDRALGTLASGTNIPGFGVMITNNSGTTLSSISLSFNTEEYRNSTSTQNIITFAYGLSGGNSATASNYLTSTSLTADSRFNLVGDQPVATNGMLTTPLVTAVSGTINVAVGIGQSIFLRWQDTNDIGNDAGLAIDDFRFSATPAAGSTAVPEPASCLILGMSLVGGLAIARRRSGR